METLFETLGRILKPEPKQPIDRSFLFKRAWIEYKIKTAHNCKANFGQCLKHQYRIAKLIALKSNQDEISKHERQLRN